MIALMIGAPWHICQCRLVHHDPLPLFLLYEFHDTNVLNNHVDAMFSYYWLLIFSHLLCCHLLHFHYSFFLYWMKFLVCSLFSLKSYVMPQIWNSAEEHLYRNQYYMFSCQNVFFTNRLFISFTFISNFMIYIQI